MHAAVLRETNGALQIESLALPAVAPGMVKVRLAASGVCHSDLSVVRGAFPAMLPTVLGHEGAGVVTDVGDGVTHVRSGDHVVLSWVVPCRQCFFCLRRHPELCEHGMDHAFAGPYAHAGDEPVFAAFGTATFGEETIVPSAAAVPIDASFPLELASLVGCGVVTGIGAVMQSAHVQPGESVAVIGCGGVGLAALQGARLSGASPLIAVDRVAEKLALARACGATEVIDASAVDAVAAVRELTSGRGADHTIEVVGTPATINMAYNAARRAGTVTIVGAPAITDVVQFGAMPLMVDSKTIRGTVYGGTDPARDFPEMVRLHREGKIDLAALVTEHIRLADIDAAFTAMERGDGARRIVVY